MVEKYELTMLARYIVGGSNRLAYKVRVQMRLFEIRVIDAVYVV